MTNVAKDLLNRAKQEYLEMPGLRLTTRQASRLWNLDAGVCQALLSTLVHEKFLSETHGGAYRRCGDGRAHVHPNEPEAPLRGQDDCEEAKAVNDPLTLDSAVPPSPSPDDEFVVVDAVGPPRITA